METNKSHDKERWQAKVIVKEKIQKELTPGESSKYCVELHAVNIAKVRRALARCAQLLDWAGSQGARTKCPLLGLR